MFKNLGFAFVFFIVFFLPECFAQSMGSSNEVDVSRSEVLDDSGARQRCEYMQALRRRANFLVQRYEDLEAKTQRLINEAPFERRSVREELTAQRKRIFTKLGVLEDEYRDLSVRIVRRGCPLRELDQISDSEVRELFFAAQKEGVFVDDHVLRVEDYGDYFHLLNEF